MTARAKNDLFGQLAARRASEAEELRVLWEMTPLERENAMWRGELSFRQLQHWTAHAPDEIPLLGRELAWIAMLTPEWADAADRQLARTTGGAS